MAEQSSADWTSTRDRETPGWAVGGTVFAAVMMIIIGVFQVLAGVTAVVKDKFFASTPNYLINWNVTGWGWVHIGIGVVVLLAGWFLLSGSVWARAVGIAMVSLSAIGNFLFIPYYPFWSILIIALDVFVIWSLASYGRRTVTY